MKEMSRIQQGMGFYGEMPDMLNVVLNTDHKLVKDVLTEGENATAEALKADIVKEGNKAAAARARKATLQLEKLGKEYRKASIAAAKK